MRNFIEKGGAAFAGLRDALFTLHFSPEDLDKCKVTLEVPTTWHKHELISRLKMDSQFPFDPVSEGTWFGIPFEIKVTDV